MTIEQKVLLLIGPHTSVDPEDIKLSSKLVDDLGFDELAVIELTMTLEEVFEITIPDEDQDALTTVQKLVDYVRAHTTADDLTRAGVAV